MKNTSFVWATVLALVMTACGGEATKVDEKEKPEKETTLKEENKETQKAPELTEEAKKIVKMWARKSYTHNDGKVEAVKGKELLELKADGTFEEIFGEKSVATGTWNVKDKNLSLKHLTGMEKDIVEKHIIKEVSDKMLMLVNEKNKMTEIYEAQ